MALSANITKEEQLKFNDISIYIQEVKSKTANEW
jgi:hypothetical protein